MIETCSTSNTIPTLQLTDEMEDHHMVGELIEWMMDGSDEHRGMTLTQQYEDMIWLAKKYECSKVLAWVELAMYRAVILNRQDREYYVDIVAALGAWPLIGQIIADLELDTSKPHWLNLKTMFDPRTWSPEDLKLYSRFGHIYVWGITQSALEAHHPEKGIDWKRMGQIFTDIMPKAE
jgi:hypothetical protein